jgi:hypothetical protein
MSASDHLGKQFRLFHGTDRNIEGSHINPTAQPSTSEPTAFASDNLGVARVYGHNLYEVETEGAKYHREGSYTNDKGFKIKRKIDPKVAERYFRITGEF